MNCLILAAGHGSRLRSVSPSKPLTPVCGIPLIEHVVTAALQAGATSFVVVTGHEAERLEGFLAALRARLTISLRSVRTPDWNRPNGLSVAAGAETIEGEYLLLMSDHLFDPAIARSLLARGGSGGVRLAVDRALSGPLLDVDDATKVEVDEDGRILSIGKALKRYNAIDTGIFVAAPALAEAIRADVAHGGGGSLSEGVQRLADERRALTMDVHGGRWIDVDDPASLALAQTLFEPAHRAA
ncbi:MAG: NTP transferase domain-containing protein [Pseudomonadota bacterium]|nr:NTP transferase domain-containing protein [Pseudomonadota bacterium]